jgi:hypothetical protein
VVEGKVYKIPTIAIIRQLILDSNQFSNLHMLMFTFVFGILGALVPFLTRFVIVRLGRKTLK